MTSAPASARILVANEPAPTQQNRRPGTAKDAHDAPPGAISASTSLLCSPSRGRAAEAPRRARQPIGGARHLQHAAVGAGDLGKITSETQLFVGQDVARCGDRAERHPPALRPVVEIALRPGGAEAGEEFGELGLGRLSNQELGPRPARIPESAELGAGLRL